VRFVPGLVADSLPCAGIGALALMRLDLDLYSATAEALDLLYDHVSPGGFVVIDDYRYLPGCAAAADEFRAARDIVAPIAHVDPIGSYWRKDGAA
jgi:O-methyltransferase